MVITDVLGLGARLPAGYRAREFADADRDGWTWMTGTAREHRGRGVARALKVEALTRAKLKGFRAMGTTKDEANRSMRGINAKLGYWMLPAHVELEKPLA